MWKNTGDVHTLAERLPELPGLTEWGSSSTIYAPGTLGLVVLRGMAEMSMEAATRESEAKAAARKGAATGAFMSK